MLRKKEPQTFISSSPSMQPVLEVIERVGSSEANVLISGENGNR